MYWSFLLDGLCFTIYTAREQQQEKSVFAKCVRHCRSRDPEDSCGASDACSKLQKQQVYRINLHLAKLLGVQGSCLLRVTWTQGPLGVVLMLNCIGSICLQYGSPLFHTEYLCAQMIVNIKSSPSIYPNGCCHP
ncbi:uncharacterized protein [Solanum tuberosum]|uniref:uncharacterized protein isoform X4 n=1 Tax=Solanum tuberosum TaxID=4113 RepID=UPI00073A50BB|nr:PREDICTED: uncharacterized protein LOC102597626 isoform X4 [Solanum tuberosum]XP_015160403.1 PREDICTED: uncharacterized protein LOC102597626 isoform X5 [Solanum tuberosum]